MSRQDIVQSIDSLVKPAAWLNIMSIDTDATRLQMVKMFL